MCDVPAVDVPGTFLFAFCSRSQAANPLLLIVMAGLVPATHERGRRGLDEGPATAAVYMLASRKYGTLYVGVTARLVQRVVEHREGLREGFTKRYGLKRLVWFERHASIVPAIQREKSLKKYRRDWKINLIERDNPNWNDLFPGLLREHGPLAHLSWQERPY